ncbi:MAG: biopolymer transporter ExbD [Xanthomonadales bacterium]|nr:biopolymer transporter ExbD [Xanthomonadales bacterium]MBK7144486.1 biopolymer transporter ExbD [Xanthomonadales bacterium]MCC6561323.1 biopolymer transporter ExbD [Xanthomonadales bacterium]
MSNHASPIAQINVTPLVDVMLVLLIIFMITAPTLTQRLLLSLPQPMPNPPPPPTAPLRLGIAADGALWFDGQAISSERFAAEVAFLGTRVQPPGIEIAAADSVAYEHVVDVFGTIKAAGIRRVGFAEAR